MTSEIDTKDFLNGVMTMHGFLVQKLTNGERTAIAALSKADLNDGSFQRGFLMGMSLILRCQGVPAYLSGEHVQTIMERFVLMAEKSGLGKHMERQVAHG